MSATERDCNTCKHHVQGRSIDDAPAKCWDCIGQMGYMKLNYLPKWEAMEEPMNPAPRRITCDTQEKASPLAVQVGGSHYKSMKIQPIEFALANNFDFFQKDIVKYISRRKGDKAKRLEDLNKAKHYIDLYIEAIQKGDIE